MPDNGLTQTQKTKVILVGIGGATCSGKTTLAKCLEKILPDSLIIHQDDFAPPEEQVPVHPIHNVRDWDAAPGAILWPKFVHLLRKVKATGKVPSDHRSHDDLNGQKDIEPITDEVGRRWFGVFEDIRKRREQQVDERIIWVLVEGFLLYWNQEVIDELDVRVFLRVPEPILKKRRYEKHGYHIPIATLIPTEGDSTVVPPPPCGWLSAPGVQSDPEESLWRDFPGSWEQMIYPAYVDAHRDVFIDGDMESGLPGSKVEGLLVINSFDLDFSMDETVSRVCRVLEDVGGN